MAGTKLNFTRLGSDFDVCAVQRASLSHVLVKDWYCSIELSRYFSLAYMLHVGILIRILPIWDVPYSLVHASWACSYILGPLVHTSRGLNMTGVGVFPTLSQNRAQEM